MALLSSFAGLTGVISIVTNGLIVNLDAGNSLSYPGIGTTWNDLSGNNLNATLVNSPTYSSSNNGFFILNGTNQYISTPRLPSTGISTQSLTWSMWVNPSITGGGDILNMQNGAYNMCPFWSTGQRFYAKVWQSADMPALSTYTVGTWYNLALKYDHSITTTTFYINGISQGTAAGAYTGSGGDNFHYIGNSGSQGSNAYFNGRVSSLNVYSRALIDSEITQNFNALRGRFGV
jgi:hypothetical protein